MEPAVKNIRLSTQGEAETSVGHDAVEQAPSVSVRDKLTALARFAPIFSAPGFQFSVRSRSGIGESGIRTLPLPVHSAEASQFVAAAYEFGWVEPFDWSGWANTPDGKGLMESPDRVKTATLGELAKLLTTYIRGERYCDGTLDGAFAMWSL